MAENGTEQLLCNITSLQPAATENESHQDDISDAEEASMNIDAEEMQDEYMAGEKDTEKNSKINGSKTWLYCDECGKSLQSAVSMEMHKIYSCNKKKKHKFKCKVCGKKLRSKETVKLHMKTMHSENKEKPQNLQCHLCDKAYKVKHRLTHHIHIVHSQKNYNCDKCNKAFASEKLVQKHTEKVHSDRDKVSCPKCSQLFATPHSMQRHLTTQHRRCKCLLCGQRFFTLENGYEHMSTAHIGQQPPFNCTICINYVTENRPKFKEHMQTHIADMSDTFPIRNYMNQKPLKCLLCGRRVDWQTSEKHIRDSHVPSEPPFKCVICQYSYDKALYLFDDVECLVKHLTSHVALVEQTPSLSPQKVPSDPQQQLAALPYKCLLCQIRLPDIKAGISHMKSDHLPESSSSLYCCTICQYTDLKHPGKYEYTNPENFVEHLLIHLVKAKFNAGQPSPKQEERHIKEKRTLQEQSGSYEVNHLDETKPAQVVKFAIANKTVVKTQRGVKTKALMRSKLQEKAVAKKKANKEWNQLVTSVQDSNQGAVVSDFLKSTTQIGKTGSQKKQLLDLPWASKQQKQPSPVLGRFKKLSNLQQTRGERLTEPSSRENTKNLQATIDPFEFTDNEFESVLDHVICFNSANAILDDDLPLAELSNPKRTEESNNMKATVNGKSEKIRNRVFQAVRTSKKKVGSKSKLRMKKETADVGNRARKPKNTNQLPHDESAEKILKKRQKGVKLETVTDMNRDQIELNSSEGASLTNKNMSEHKDNFKKKSITRIPEQNKKHNLKIKQRDPKAKQQKLGNKVVKAKRKAKEESVGQENSPIKRRKTRLSRKLAKEAKKKTKLDGPPRKTILSSKDMLDILEDVKNESKMKKKKKSKKLKPHLQNTEKENKSEGQRGKRKTFSNSNKSKVPNKKRKFTKAIQESQENKGKDTVAEVIDQVAKNIVGNVNVEARKEKNSTIKLKIKLKPKVSAITPNRRSVLKRVVKKRVGKRKTVSKQPIQTRKLNTKRGRPAVPKSNRADAFVDENDMEQESGQSLKDEPDESPKQIKVKRNPKIKTTDEVKKHMRKEKPKSPPVYDDDFKDSKLKLSVSPKKDDRLAKLIASVAKSLHVEVEIEGEEQPENSTIANSSESEQGVTEKQTKLVTEKADMEEQHKEIKEHKVPSEKDSCPSFETKFECEKVEHASKEENVTNQKTSTEPSGTQDSEKLVNGSTEAKEVDSSNSSTTVDVKEEVLVNGNAKTTEDVQQTDKTEVQTALDSDKMPQDETFKYKCEVCGRRYMQEYSYQRHMQCHSGEHPYACNVCGASYSCPGTLEKHMRTHTGEKPYKCTICGRGFTQSTNRNRHMMTHTGLKPWKCPTCGKGFQQKIHVEAHLSSVHSVTSQYMCSVCKREFTRPDALKRHLRIHTGERPFSCAFCPKTFGRKECLKTHVASYHSKEQLLSNADEGTIDAPAGVNPEPPHQTV